MEQRFLTDDEIRNAKAMVGWQSWFDLFPFLALSLVLGVWALGGNPVIILVFLPVGSLAVVLSLSRVRHRNKVMHDIERRAVEVLEGAPEHVRTPRGAIRGYLDIGGRTIEIPRDICPELSESYMVKIAFLPTALVAVHVEAFRGTGVSVPDQLL